jgi:hypothetical protein
MTCLCILLPCRCLICVQVDVTAQGAAGDTAAPAWTKSPSDEAEKVQQGNQAASLISSALQNLGWGASPWAQISGTIMRAKPHKASDVAYQALLRLQQREGQLRLNHFRRVKQLGAGDVGLVDLVQLQVRLWRYINMLSTYLAEALQVVLLV